MDLQTRIKSILMMAEFKSPTLVIRALAREGLTNVPTISAISNLYNKFCTFGTVQDLPHTGRPRISNEESTHLVEEILEENPKSTLTELSAATGLSRETVRRRIKMDLCLKSYKIQIL